MIISPVDIPPLATMEVQKFIWFGVRTGGRRREKCRKEGGGGGEEGGS
jgi:hypothetical protein